MSLTARGRERYMLGTEHEVFLRWRMYFKQSVPRWSHIAVCEKPAPGAREVRK